ARGGRPRQGAAGQPPARSVARARAQRPPGAREGTAPAQAPPRARQGAQQAPAPREGSPPMMSAAGWLTLHIASGENAGRVILLPADRIVAVVELEGGAGLAYSDGGTMQVLETAAEVAELLEAIDGSVVTLEGVRAKQAKRETTMRALEVQLRQARLEHGFNDDGEELEELDLVPAELRANMRRAGFVPRTHAV